MSGAGDITSAIVDCPTCGEAEATLNPIVVALVVLLAIILIYTLSCLGPGFVQGIKDGFASQRAYEVDAQARDHFTKAQSDSTFSEYKTKVPQADAVQYTDVKALWEKGQLTPDNVQQVL